jgi:2-haloacid dehalogenase
MDRPKFLTFDCYGTLIDFDMDNFIVDYLGPRLDGIDVDHFVREFSKIRFEETLEPYRHYRELLPRSLLKAMSKFGLDYHDQDGAAIVAAVPTWGPFPEVPGVLDRIRKYCKIVIMSNTDDDLIVGNLEKIGVPFDRVITAQQAKAYKPSKAMFDFALKELGCEVTDILHVAQGYEYDIVPTRKFGWTNVWINRYDFIAEEAYRPNYELSDLSGLPELLNI